MPERRGFLKSVAATAVGSTMIGMGEAANSAEAGEMTFRDRLLECLGGPWPEPGPLNATLVKTEQKDSYRLEWVTYEVEPGDRVSTILIVPDGVSATSPAPAVCVWHEHAGRWAVGKAEPAGLDGDPMHFTGVALAKLGYVVICPDALCFGELRIRRGGRVAAVVLLVLRLLQLALLHRIWAEAPIVREAP